MKKFAMAALAASFMTVSAPAFAADSSHCNHLDNGPGINKTQLSEFDECWLDTHKAEDNSGILKELVWVKLDDQYYSVALSKLLKTSSADAAFEMFRSVVTEHYMADVQEDVQEAAKLVQVLVEVEVPVEVIVERVNTVYVNVPVEVIREIIVEVEREITLPTLNVDDITVAGNLIHNDAGGVSFTAATNPSYGMSNNALPSSAISTIFQHMGSDFGAFTTVINEIATKLTEAYNEGYTEGYDDGYRAGYQDGWNDALDSIS